MAREERRLTVELMTARELSDEEAQAIVGADRAGGWTQGRGDADASIRTLGGIVLQAGSYRARRERARKT